MICRDDQGISSLLERMRGLGRLQDMEEILSASALSLGRAIRARRVSSAEVVDAYLQRIDQVNPAINAVVQRVDERARAEARAADDALGRGKTGGPFHGVPFTVKDIFDVAGVVSAAGLAERATHVPDSDAVVVARMRAAGTILLGKTNCPPGGAGVVTENPIYGATRNPYDLDRSPSGSSGGEAAAIAAGASPLGFGSDSGGSIRTPAHYCGIAALRPTVGRVPNTGAFELPGGLSDPRSQIGPMSRWAEDLGPALAIVAGVDWRDSGVIPMPAADPSSVELRRLRVACYADVGTAPPTPETWQAVWDAARTLTGAGAVVEETRPPNLDHAWDITLRYWRSAKLRGREIERLMRDWDAFRTTMLGFIERYDLILCPVADEPAVPLGVEGNGIYCLPYSLTGYPCVVVRAGTSPEGLSIGVQVVARPWREDVALAAARWIETALGGWSPPPL
jgi:amidase